MFIEHQKDTVKVGRFQNGPIQLLFFFYNCLQNLLFFFAPLKTNATILFSAALGKRKTQQQARSQPLCTAL